MKTFAQTAWPRPIRRHRVPGGRRSTEVPGRHAYDQHEQQARDVARRFLQGQERLARMLTPTAAAGVTVPASRAELLPNALRGELERGFGADLSAIRLHRDAAAALAVREHGAHAFASGPNLFFGAGMFDPSSEWGRELIAHEVAHVLQQTGRPAAQGRVRATPVVSTGSIQAAMPDFLTLRTLHAPDKKKRSDAVAAKYETVADLVANRLTQPDPGAALDTFVTDNLGEIKDWPAEAESLLYDTLKLKERWDAAASLIEREEFAGGLRIRTALWSDELAGALEARNKGEAVYVKAAEKSPVLQTYADEYVHTIETFVFQPLDAPIPPLARQGKSEGTIRDHAKEISENLEDPTNLSINEWLYKALLVLAGLDGIRRQQLKSIRKTANEAHAKVNEPTLFTKRRFAEGVKAWGDDFLTSTKGANGISQYLDHELDPAWEPFVKALGWRVTTFGRRALEVWDRQEALGAAQDAFFRKTNDPAADAVAAAEAVEALKGVKQVGERVGLPALLVDTLTELNKPSSAPGAAADTRPRPEEVRTRAAALAERWKRLLTTKLEPPEPRLFHERKTDEVVAYLWLALWVDRGRGNLSWMAGGPAGAPHLASMDDVVLRRIRTAYPYRRLAEPLAWDAVVKAANAILTAELEPDSVIAILPDAQGKFWHEVPVEIEAVAQISRIRTWEPITGRALALLYRADYYRALAKKIEDLRPKTEADERKLVDAKAAVPFIIARAEKDIAGLPRPHKWIVESARWAHARKAGSRTLPADLITAHRSWSGELAAETPTDFYAIFPDVLGLGGELRVWFLPPPWHIIPVLKGVDLLNARVASEQPGKDAAEKQGAARKLDDDSWWSSLGKALKRSADPSQGLTDAELTQLQEALVETLKGERRAALQSAQGEMKLALRTDRQLLADIIRDDLQLYRDTRRYDAVERVLSNVRKYAIAASRLWEYDKEAEFVTDVAATAALTALMLDIAPDLLEAFRYADLFDIVHGLLGYLEEASAFVSSFEALDEKERRNYLPSSQDTPAWLTPRKTALADITGRFRRTRASVQRREGFKAYAKDNTIEVAISFSKKLTPDHLLVPRYGGFLGEASDTRYRVTKVLQDFIFHPAYGYGELPVAGRKKPAAPTRTGYSAQQFLQHDDKTPVELPAGGKLLQIAVLRWDAKRKVHVNKGRKDIGPSDAGWDDLYNGITWAAFGTSMETAMEIIEAQINLYLDVLEEIPGWGRIITAGRIAAAIADFFSSHTYEDMLEIIAGGLKDTAMALYQRLQDAADPTSLIELFLFGDPRLDYLLAHTRLGAAPAAGAQESPNKSRLRKIVDAFRRLGRALFRALRALHKRVQTPMEDIRAFVATRPILAFAFHFAATHIYALARAASAFLALTEDLAKHRQPRGITDLTEQLKEEQGNFPERVQQLIAKIETLQLPPKIIDMRPAYQAIIDELVRLGAKAIGTEARIFAMVIYRTGLLDLITAQIAQAIVDQGLDPNIYWRETIVPAISKKFTEARDALVDELNNVLQSPAFSKAFGKVPAAPPATVTTDGPEFEETREGYIETVEPDEGAAPVPSLDRPLRLRPADVPASGPGQALGGDVRAGLERGFGQDLRHVRLHTGTEAGAMTDAFGVDGLATGSHIFLRPGLTPRAGRGASVVRHEVGHVIQQTGPRPLDGGASPIPVAGRPAAGLDYDPARERHAHALAEAAGARLLAPGAPPPPVAITARVAAGLEPFDLDPYAVAKLLKSVSSLEAVLKAGEAVERKPTKQKLPSEADKTVIASLKALKGLRSHAGLKPAKVFTNALPLIENRFAGKKADSTAYLNEASIEEIAKEALRPLPGEESKEDKDKAADKVVRVLDPTHFARELESYVAARTGIVLALDMRMTAAPAGASQKTTIDATDPFKSIKVLFVYLPKIDGRSPLWGDAVDNTWPNATAEFKQKARGVLRDVLTSKGVNIAVFAAFGSEYKFSIITRREVEELIQKPKTGGLDPKDLPDWKTYADASDSNSSKIGVRLATYGHASQTGTGRESHHLTQFLLADYFANANDTAQPFRVNRDYPGVRRSGDLVDTISDDVAGGDTIQVGKTFGSKSGRGTEMPAISLSAATHRQGDLHVTPEADDLDNANPKKSQAYSVNNRFTVSLPPALRATATTAEYNEYLKTHEKDDVAETIYEATQKTYRWLEKEMSRKLDKSMPALEHAYYVGLSEFNSTVDISQNETEQKEFFAKLTVVAVEAKGHNDKVMKTLGWTLG